MEIVDVVDVNVLDVDVQLEDYNQIIKEEFPVIIDKNLVKNQLKFQVLSLLIQIVIKQICLTN